MSSIIRADRWQNSNGVAYNSVLQVVSTTKTDTFTTTSTTAVDVTGLSVSITPRFSTSKILILGSVGFGIDYSSGSIGGFFQVAGGNASAYRGNAASNRTRAANAGMIVSGGYHLYDSLDWINLNYLDSPATTSEITYKVQAWVTATTLYVNRNRQDTDSAAMPRTASTITVMEIAQ